MFSTQYVFSMVSHETAVHWYATHLNACRQTTTKISVGGLSWELLNLQYKHNRMLRAEDQIVLGCSLTVEVFVQFLLTLIINHGESSLPAAPRQTPCPLHTRDP